MATKKLEIKNQKPSLPLKPDWKSSSQHIEQRTTFFSGKWLKFIGFSYAWIRFYDYVVRYVNQFMPSHGAFHHQPL